MEAGGYSGVAESGMRGEVLVERSKLEGIQRPDFPGLEFQSRKAGVL